MRCLQFMVKGKWFCRIKTLTHLFQTPATRSYSNVRTISGQDQTLPVLIVGAGPVGLVLAMLLTKLGVPCAVLEKKTRFSEHPQAHFINNRSMEIFHKLDGLADEIKILQSPVDLWRKFIYCTSLSGSILGNVDHMQSQDLEQVHSPVSVAHFSQYKLTRLLLKKLKDLNFDICKHDQAMGLNTMLEKKILLGHECVSIDLMANGVAAGVTFYKNGQKCIKNILCNILVGADGAESKVRKLLGIKMIGESALQKLISIHFFSRDLAKYLLFERPAMLYFIFNPEGIGVVVAHDLEQGEFILQLPFYPPQHCIEEFSPEVCEKLILKLAGQELKDVVIVDVKPWVMHAEVAERFVSCDSRVILAGDAAHRFPPAGGFGMNTGIQDAHNLAWKIASKLHGIASSSIIQTYELERRPIAIFNTELSVTNFKAATSVAEALGISPAVANTVHRIINDGFGPILPSGLKKAFLEGIFFLGRAQLHESLLNERNPLGFSKLSKLKAIFDEGKSLQLQFPAEDLGFRYLEGALVLDSSSDQKKVVEVPTGRRRDYIPSSEPGSRLPHMNLRISHVSSNKEFISTLDLINADEVEFLLIIAPVEESYNLAGACFMVAETLKVSLKMCVIWPHGQASVSGGRNFHPSFNIIDATEVKSSTTSSSWWEVCQMTNKGAILVRPDGHVAWRVKSEIVGNSYVKMKRVFSIILGM